MLLASTPFAAGQAPVFPVPEHLTPSQTQGLCAGDWNGDGRADIAVALATPSDARVALYPGDGQGDLLAPTEWNVPHEPVVPVFADLDGDGHLDLLTGCRGDSDVVVGAIVIRLGNGAGGTAGLLSQSVIGGLTDLVVADFDGDGTLDLALASPNQAVVTLQRGLGDGSFAAPVAWTGGAQPVAIDAGDADQDGDQDLAIANTGSGTVSLRLNAGDGSFASPQHFAVGAQPADVLFVPGPGGGSQDLVAANAGASSLTRLPALGGGSYGPGMTLPVAPLPSRLAQADFDLDGNADLALTHSASAGVKTTTALSLLHGDGLGGFLTVQQPLVGDSDWVTTLDANGDGRPDAAVTRSDGDVALLLGDGLGGVDAGHLLPTQAALGGVALADLDGDGRLDVVATQASPAAVVTLAGHAPDLPGPALTWSLPGGGLPIRLAVGDLDNDGALDVVSVNSTGGDIAVFAGDGAGGLLPPMRHAVGSQPRDIVLIDMDGNGWLDVVTCLANSDKVAWLANGPSGLAAPATVPVGDFPVLLSAGLIDGDALPDVVVVNEFSASLSILLADGTGGWLPAQTIAGTGLPTEVIVTDLDGDGHTDLVGVTGQSFWSRAGNGTGTFGPKLTLGTFGGNATSLVLVDVDGDGARDAVAGLLSSQTYTTSASIGFIAADGAGGWLPARDFLVGPKLDALAAGDLDGDGRPDLAGTTQGLEALTVVPNTSRQAWADLGFALPGSHAPRLVGSGALLAGTPGSLAVLDAIPSSLLALAFSPTSAPAPFKGGTLAAFPPTVIFPLLTDPLGHVLLTWTDFPAVGPGSTFHFQPIQPDPGGPAGFALGNCLKGTAP